MTVSVDKLRVGLLVGASLLVAVIAAFLGYAHYRAHRFLTGLPGRMGMDIQQETNGVTYSQSVKGKTIYTIHAAKAIKRRDGKVTLEDVGIVLYGRGDGSSDRVDRIYGKEFEYDQSAGIVSAVGEVHIDLQAPAPVDAKAKAEYAKGQELAASSHNDERLIHVKTSGLVFLQKLGVAATEQDLEFEFSGMTGHAHGAEYNSDTGMLVLQSAVHVSGLKDGQPTVLTASRAEMDRQKQQVILSRAVYTVVGDDAGARVAKGDRVTAYLRHEGSVERAVAEGGVSLTDAGGTVTAQRGEVHLNAVNQPETATLTGAVRFVADEALRKAEGEAAEGRARFSRAGVLEHVSLTGPVRLQERTRASVTVTDGWSDRELVSQALELAVVSGADKRLLLREARATGAARLTLVNPPVLGAKVGHRGATTSVISGDVLTARFTGGEAGVRSGTGGAGASRRTAIQVQDVHGAGHTGVRRVTDTGAVETSSGDVLDAVFRESGGAGKAGQAGFGAGGLGATEIATAVQQGHVVLTQRAGTGAAGSVAGRGPGAQGSGGVSGSGEQRAVAERVAYDGTTEKVTLTGAVQISDADGTVSADRVVMDQATGDAVAEGSVKASYLAAHAGTGASPEEVLHVLAARGELKHDSDVALFYGGAGRPARMWQGASQVEAPVLRLEQREKRLVARSDGPGLGVHAVFVNAGTASDAGAKGGVAPGTSGKGTAITGTGAKGWADRGIAAKGSAAGRAVPVRIASHEMTYVDGARRADLTGGVLVEQPDGTMRAQRAVVYLQAAEVKGKAGTGPGGFMGGSVERLVVLGHVELAQPGRKALGEQLVYTAADGLFVLTGLPGMPPRMMDEARGAITGATMSFHTGDNSVVVANGPDSASGQRVRTETQVKQ